MSKSPDKYVPKHRAPGKHKARRTWSGHATPFRAARTTIAVSGLAFAVTGASVAGGVLSDGEVVASPATARPSAEVPTTATAATMSAEQLQARAERATVSRSDRRGETDPAKAAVLSVAQGHAVSRSEKLSEGNPRDIARALLPLYGFSDSQFSCLDSLYVSESDWRVDADNPTSSAYGIPQALTQLHDLPADYMTSAESQIRWGLDYIKQTYGTPCNAWAFKRSHNWY